MPPHLSESSSLYLREVLSAVGAAARGGVASVSSDSRFSSSDSSSSPAAGEAARPGGLCAAPGGSVMLCGSTCATRRRGE